MTIAQRVKEGYLSHLKIILRWKKFFFLIKIWLKVVESSCKSKESYEEYQVITLVEKQLLLKNIKLNCLAVPKCHLVV